MEWLRSIQSLSRHWFWGQESETVQVMHNHKPTPSGRDVFRLWPTPNVSLTTIFAPLSVKTSADSCVTAFLNCEGERVNAKRIQRVCVCVRVSYNSLWWLWLVGGRRTPKGILGKQRQLASGVCEARVVCPCLHTRTYKHTFRYSACPYTNTWDRRQTHIPAVPLKGKGIPKSWNITHYWRKSTEMF